MICRTLPANGIRLSACTLKLSGPFPGPPATPGKRLAALELCIHSNAPWGTKTQNFRFVLLPQSQLSSHSSASAQLLYYILERLWCMFAKFD